MSWALALAGLRSEAVDGLGHGASMTAWAEAHQGDVRCDKDDGGGECDGGGRFKGVSLTAETPGGEWAEEEREGGEDRGHAERGEGWAGEVEEMRHGERVAADSAMGH
jgi:hypothetical protein